MRHPLVPRRPVADPAISVGGGQNIGVLRRGNSRRGSKACVPKRVAEQSQRAAITTLCAKDGREVHASVASFHA